MLISRLPKMSTSGARAFRSTDRGSLLVLAMAMVADSLRLCWEDCCVCLACLRQLLLLLFVASRPEPGVVAMAANKARRNFMLQCFWLRVVVVLEL